MIKTQIEHALEERGIKLQCSKKSSSFQCRNSEQKVLDATEVVYDHEKKFVVVKFSKKHDRNRHAEKILNEIKIPEENELNLHLRVKQMALEFFTSHNY